MNTYIRDASVCSGVPGGVPSCLLPKVTVGFATKSKRGALPKMVLLGDIVGEDAAAVAAAASEVERLANAFKVKI
jgi:FAD/FMN-containing dehydrogenase